MERRRSPLVLAAAVVGGLLVLGGVGLAAAIVTAPDAFEVTRTVRIEAPPEAVWPHVEDYRAFVAWSPWTDRDPNQVSTFSEPSAGVGATYAWSGNEDVGRGEMETLTADPPRLMTQRLTFFEPMASTAEVRFELAPHGEATDVTWHMRSELDPIGRAFSWVMDFDALIGPDFEEGLRRLRVRVEEAEAERRAAAARAAEDEAKAADSPLNTSASTDGGLTVAGRASTAYHLVEGPPARLASARFTVTNAGASSVPLTLDRVELLHDATCAAPPQAVAAEPSVNGLFARETSQREATRTVDVPPSATLELDASFAIVEAVQAECPDWAARVTFDAGGVPVVATAALRVLAREPLGELPTEP